MQFMEDMMFSKFFDANSRGTYICIIRGDKMMFKNQDVPPLLLKPDNTF